MASLHPEAPRSDRWAAELSLSIEIEDLLASPEVWALRPNLLLDDVLRKRAQLDRTFRRKETLARQPFIRRQPYRVALREDRVLAVYSTLNQARALGVGPARETGRPWAVKFSPARSYRSWRGTSRLAGELTRRSPGLEATIGRRRLSHELHLLAEALIWSERELKRLKPRGVVVSTQHSPLIRCVVWAAREQHVPVAYVPHAPFADVPHYVDLPFDVALLRGPRERRAYAEWGANEEQLVVVGDPGLRELTCAPQSDTVVAAPSPWNRDRLRAFFDGLNECLDDYVVSLHPRLHREDVAGLLGKGAIVRTGRTVEEVASSGGIVVQHGSGVGLEAMRVGAPVIDFDPFCEGVPYPCLRTSLVKGAHSVEQLASAIEIARSEGDQASVERQMWAKSWTQWDGTSAQRALDLELAELRFHGSSALDGWSDFRTVAGRRP